ncbi:MAG: GNAT family N-acetyltransferase [Prochlorococcus marinus XMU1425]|nr:GNAT family N-acetyltransferase [Prochlorococcus marinus XMU1425]MCR8534151.1 GNAT family N-acetyltransferase [Prochlorococcus marinus XMU1426]
MKMNRDVEIDIDNNIKLRTLLKIDVSEKYVAWLNDYDIMKYTEQKYSEHFFSNVCDFVEQKYNSENDLLFGIFSDDKHIGNIKLGPISWDHKSAEVSYFIGDKKFWGRGIATKCVKSIVEYGTKVLLLEKFNSGYYELNLGSEKVLKKCGFRVEGVRVSNVIFEGKRINSILVGFVPKSS